MALIQLEHVSKRFGEKIIFKDLSMKLEEKKMYAIVGKSGSGKTTLINMIGGIEHVTDGSLRVFGQTPKNMRSSAIRKLLKYKISFLFQNYALSDNDTVKYNLEMALTYSGQKNKKEAMAKALETVGLWGFEQKKVYTLSGGEQQRVALARLILKPTELILADEPTGNLDKKNRDMVFRILQDFKEQGKTILIATHDMDLAKQCDAIIEI